MTANKVATSGSIKNTILMFSVPFNARERGDIAVISLRIKLWLTETNNPFENFVRIGGNFQTFLLFILSKPITQSSKKPRHSIHQNCCFNGIFNLNWNRLNQTVPIIISYHLPYHPPTHININISLRGQLFNPSKLSVI